MQKHRGPRHISKNTGWDSVAKWYDNLISDKGHDLHRDIVIPSTIKLLGPKSSEKILDLGCGQGALAREIVRSGAHVTGVDLSKKLINIAVSRSKGVKDLNFRVADAEDLNEIADESFDAVVSVLALSNMDHLSKVIGEAYRVLVRAGRFVFVINHPCFRIPRQSGWGFDEKRKLQYRRVDKYMSEMKIPIQMHPGDAPDVYTWTFHRPLSEYFDLLGSTGFTVNKLEEWVSRRKSLPGSKAKAENVSREEIPLFLAVGAIKPHVL